MPKIKKGSSKKSRKASDAKDGAITAEEEQKHKEADEKDAEEYRYNTKKEKENAEAKGFLGKLWPYTAPRKYVYLGILISIIQGTQMPVFAIFIVKLLFGMQNPDFDKVRDVANTWCLAMLILGVIALITGTIQKGMFGILGENVAKKMREELYKSFLSKHQGWFDVRAHSPGSLSSSLATDAQIVNGAATEGIAVQFESSCSLIAGIVIGFYYSWKVSLVCFACVPFMVAASIIQAKFQMGFEEAAAK